MEKQRELAAALSKRLASRKVGDDVVQSLTKDLAAVGQVPIDVDICMYGICIDYFVDRGEVVSLIERLYKHPGLGGIKIFPKGILDPTKFLVQVERAVGR
jgi:hypothetical protein